MLKSILLRKAQINISSEVQTSSVSEYRPFTKSRTYTVTSSFVYSGRLEPSKVKNAPITGTFSRLLQLHHCTMAVSQADIQSVGSVTNPKLKAVPDVKIDKNGKFKYILIKVHDPEKEREFKHIVRGTNKPFHADILDDVTPDIESADLDCECVGGGRINHEPNKKKIEIFGYSQGFGRANHYITAHILGKKYREYDVTWTNDGY